MWRENYNKMMEEGMLQNPKVNILLAAYNGRPYLEKQLDSLLRQTYKNVVIYIRDDGSTDGTPEFIHEYIDKHPEMDIRLLDNDGRNLRASGNFYQLLHECEPAEYYALCDQDDEWYPNKLQWAVEALQKEKADKVLLYYSACDYCTEEGKLIRRSPKQRERLELQDVLYYTPGSGFTIVMNEKASQELVLRRTPGPEMHDRWLIRGAVCLGKVIYDSRSTAAHIRHADAVTAEDAGNGRLLIHFVKDELFGEQPKKDKKALIYFDQVFQSVLNTRQKKVLQLFTGKNTPIRWGSKVCYPRRLRRRLGGEIALRLLFFIGRM